MSELKQNIGLFQLILIAVSSTIGSGIFLTPAMIADALFAPSLILLVWVVGGLVALAGALTFAELGSAFPQSGGVYVYLRESFGGLWAFLYGWVYFLVVASGGIAALCVASAMYFARATAISDFYVVPIALVALASITVLNIVGVRYGVGAVVSLTIIKLIGIATLITIGFGWGSVRLPLFDFTVQEIPDNLWAGFSAAAIGVLWSYGGWQHATYAAGEVRDARKTVPMALFLGASAVTAVYVIVNLAYFSALTPDEMAGSTGIAADAMMHSIGSVGAAAISILIIISTIGTAAGYMFTAPRLYYAMDADGVFIGSASVVHPKYLTPYRAILLQSLWAGALVILWGTFERLITYVVFVDWIFFGLTAAALFTLRKKHGEYKPGYSTFAYPYTPLFFILAALWLVASTIWNKPVESISGLLFLCGGIPVYYILRNLKT